MRSTLPAALLLGILSVAAPQIGAQPVQNGFLAGTCYSGSNPFGYVVGLNDVRNANLQPFNANWVPPMWHGPSNNWTKANLGEVFGLDFDAAGNLYVAATRVYNQNAPPGGPGGSGAIYRLNGVTGAITNLVTTLAAPCGPVVGTTMLPNSGAGLGNIAYDEARDQFFVTNFEDGVIYRISSAGVVLSFHDPFGADACVAGAAPLGERLWGINVYNNRVYFSRWVEDWGVGNSSPGTYNEIWSIALDGSGDFTGVEQLEITMPNYPGQIFSNPVADIAFSDAGRMLLAERTMRGSATDPFNPSAHRSRLLEYRFVSGSWVPSPATFVVGTYSVGHNAAGGCDYGYGDVDPVTREPVDCDSTVWASGDALRLFSYPPPTPASRVYGWVRMPASGGGPANSIMIDADGDTVQGDKTQIGDLEIYKECPIDQPQDPCEGIRVSSKPVQGAGGPTGEGCCWEISIAGLAPGTWSSVSANLLTDSVSFTGVIGPTGWSVTNTGTYATWDTTGTINATAVTGLQFCLYSLVGPPQEIEVTLHGANGEVCVDTIRVDCPEMPPPFPPCVLIDEQNIECLESGSNGSLFDLSFVVTNQSPFSLPPYNLPAENLVVYPVGGGITVTPGSVNFSSPLGHGASSGPLSFTIGGPNAQPGDTVCIVVQLHGKQLPHDYQWCCPPDTLCVVLPDCHDCCDSVEISMREGRVRQRGNYGATIEAAGLSVLPGPVVSATATVLSVESSDIWCPKFVQGQWTVVNTGGAGPLLGLVTGESITPTMPLAWGITPPSTGVGWGTVPAGVPFSGGSIRLDMKFPGSRLRWRCRDTLTLCIRYTFTDSACRTCDTVVYHRIPRLGQLEIAEADPVFGGVHTLRKNSPLFDGSDPLGTNPLYEGRASDAGHDSFFDIWIEDDLRIEGPSLDLDVVEPGRARLSVSHWFPDGFPGEPEVVLDSLRVTGGPGIRVTGIGSSGQDGVVREGTGITAVDLSPAAPDSFFDIFFAVDPGVPAEEISLNYAKIEWDYRRTGQGGDPRERLRSRPFFEILDRGDRRDTARLTVRKEVDKSTPYLYKVLVTAGDYDTGTTIGPVRWMAPESIRLRLPDGIEAVAIGPVIDKSTPILRFAREGGIDKATPILYQAIGALDTDDDHDGYIETTLDPGETAELILVVVGDRAAGPFDLTWEGINGNGAVIAEGSLTLDTATSSVGNDGTPGGAIHILDARPNPTSGAITASFTLARSGRATLSVVDAAGREVLRPVDDTWRPIGRTDLVIETAQMPEGTYFLRLETSEGIQTRRIVVVR